jgi:ATP synthase protein I
MSPWKDVGRYGSVGIELMVWMALGYYGGRALDHRLGAGGYVTFAGLAFGLFAGFRSIWKTGEHMRRELMRDGQNVDYPARPKDAGPETHDDDEPQH